MINLAVQSIQKISHHKDNLQDYWLEKMTFLKVENFDVVLEKSFCLMRHNVGSMIWYILEKKIGRRGKYKIQLSQQYCYKHT